MIGERLGPWVVRERLGKGGMGEVFRAEPAEGEPAGAAAALKLLPGSFDPEDPELERFRREGAVLAELSHPGIVRALGPLVVEPTRAWYAMELVAGRDLARVLREEGRLPPARAIEIARALLEALDHAHARGVVHRDVKPSNVLLDGEGRPRLVDFGLARVAGRSGLTRTGTVLGTPEYMAPEQAQGEEAGAPADVYALGATLFAMLAGRPPFEAESPLAVLRLHVEKPPPPLPGGLGLPPGLEGVIRRALAKAPRDRWPSAGAMARALSTLPPEGAAAPAPVDQGSTRDLAVIAGGAASGEPPGPWTASTASWSPPQPPGPGPTAAPGTTPALAPAPGAPRPAGMLLLVGIVPLLALAALALWPAPPEEHAPAPVAAPTSAATAPIESAIPRVSVRLRGGGVIAGELLELDPARGQIVVKDLSGLVQRLDMSQVDGLTYDR